MEKFKEGDLVELKVNGIITHVIGKYSDLDPSCYVYYVFINDDRLDKKEIVVEEDDVRNMKLRKEQ